MTLAAKAASFLGYRVLPTSILTFLAYVAIFAALTITDTLPKAPTLQKQLGLDLNQAYDDLHHIAAKPHPYISHANDNVRAYILSRVLPLAEKFSHVHVANDLTSNASWSSPGSSFGVYFEGTNVLIKVDGTSNTAQGAILFSAHYDSVSTATGATDDGMGIVTLLQLVQYFAEHRTMRTAIFNVNNGEEDGLHGAHAFLEHPWSSLTETFLNLEGAAAGGRPILFRATTTSPVQTFRNKKFIPHPHANVLSSDAFSRGIIRSSTDFSVYSGPGSRGGMEGLDLAFYKGRSRYHTKYDAVQHTVGGINSLWSMMEVARGVGVGLLNQPFDDKSKADEGSDKTDDPVYFDLFKSIIIVFPLARLLTFNIVVLVAGPVLLILLLVFEKYFLNGQGKENHRIIEAEAIPPQRPEPNRNGSSGNTHPHLRYFTHSRTRRTAPQAVAEEEQTNTEVVETETSPVKEDQNVSWAHTIWRHAKFWIALVLTAGAQVLLMWGYVSLNPFTIYSSPYVVLFSFMALSYLTIVFALTLPSSLPFFHPEGQPSSHFLLQPAQQQKHAIFFHLYLFTWILLVLATLGITKLNPGLGGGYLISSWNFCVGSGYVLGIVERLVTSAAWKGDQYEELQGEEPHRHVEDANETTPLIWREHDTTDHSQHVSRRHAHMQEDEEGGMGGLGTWWWIPQFLVSVPFPVILLGHIAMLLLDSVPQTMTDGANPWGVYSLTLLLALSLVVPLTPFAYKLRPNRLFTLFVLTIFLTSTVYALVAFPFSPDAPLKVFFQQRIEFSSKAQYGSLESPMHPRVFTAITGPQKYLLTSIVRNLPSSEGQGILCRGENTKPGLLTCEWETGPRMWPSPGSYTPTPLDVLPGGAQSEWKRGQLFKAEAVRTGPASAVITVKGRNTRSCRLYFDKSPIHQYTIWPTASFSSDGTASDERRDGRTEQHGFAVHSTDMQDGYEIGPQGVEAIRLWSRTWEREFRVEIHWQNVTALDTPDMHGRIACEWSEYESGLVDNGSLYEPQEASMPFGDSNTVLEEDRPKIPAFEEVLTFLPEWATVSKFSDGLVEAWVPFVV